MSRHACNDVVIAKGMSAYWVAMWTVQNESISEHDKKTLLVVLEHVKQKDPLVLSVRTGNVRWGSETTRALTALEDSVRIAKPKS